MKQTEDQLHKQCVEWFNIQHGNSGAFLHHSPNENPRGNMAQMICYNRKMKKLGRLTGFPDLLIGYKSKILYIEFKSIKGILSEAQKELFPRIQNQGFELHIVKTLDEFIKITNQFILC